MNYRLVDNISKETVLVGNEQIKDAIEDMRKINRRMCMYMDWAETATCEESKELYEQNSSEMYHRCRGMLDMFNALTGLELNMCDALFGTWEEIK